MTQFEAEDLIKILLGEIGVGISLYTEDDREVYIVSAEGYYLTAGADSRGVKLKMDEKVFSEAFVLQLEESVSNLEHERDDIERRLKEAEQSLHEPA